MRRSALKLYGPFIALVLFQAAVIFVAPSRGQTGQEAATFEPEAAPVDEIDGDGGPAGTGLGTTGSDSGGTGTTGTSPGTDTPASADGSGTEGTAGTSPGNGTTAPSGTSVQGDTSHCKGEFQFDILLINPPCRPAWPDGADNGGATSQGVTDDTIRIVDFDSEPNPQVDAILASQGLVEEEDDHQAFMAAAVEFIHEHYELYGRKIELIRVVGDCPTTPPDYAACNAAARKVVELKPFMVTWATPLYASVFDIWARAGIISVGGWHFDESLFTQRRPFRYDVFMDGTRSADVIAEYYCKKMAGATASHSGQVIHPEIGTRGQVQRKLGIVVPEIPANVSTAKRVQRKVSACDSGYTPPLFTYESDIERATEQTDATVSGLIDAGATTVVCMCDPIAPAFLTAGMTSQNYFPEHLLPGLGLLDYDLLGRLYDKQQWQHAFGPSHLQVLVNLDQTDAARVWQATGHSGHPCGQNGCGLPWAYINFAATAIHLAGPDLNPLTVEQALLSAAPRGGQDPRTVLVKLGPGDYTALSDVKEVHWSETATSAVDGRPGAYVPLNDGRRYELGEWPAGFTRGIPAAPK